ncbi:hypothetical protein EB796_006271 [Bugula neritina]|uniref:Uncharacterized protein n=1 Tax=Bugula neritina TaxID=10212 RepID=A0A7J7KC42_BUGNE|nr:hypothetical protein EB796_006271 [Bugula neritina]
MAAEHAQPPILLSQSPELEPSRTTIPQCSASIERSSMRRYSKLQVRSVWGLSVTQLISGLLAMVSGITIILTSQHSHTTYTTANSYLATPVWVGLAIAVTGVVGMCAAKKSSLYLIFASMVCNMIAVNCVIVLLFVTAPSVIKNSPPCYLGSVYYRARYHPADCSIDEHLLLGMEAILLVICFIQFISTVICSAIGFAVVCCKFTQQNRPMVYYPTASDTSNVIYQSHFTPQNQQNLAGIYFQERGYPAPTPPYLYESAGQNGISVEKPPQYDSLDFSQDR